MVLAFAGSNGLKRCDLLFNFSAFAFWTPEFSLFIFCNFHNQGKRLVTLFADEFVSRHDTLLLQLRRIEIPKNMFRLISG